MFDFPVNLDAFSTNPDDLRQWADRLRQEYTEHGIPLGVALTLAWYSENKALSISDRLHGRIATAQHAERRNSVLYASLPPDYRW